MQVCRFWLVDDRDGRVVAELDSQEEALRILGALGTEDETVPDYLCIVEFHDHQGAIVGTDTSVTIRPLS